MPAAVVVHILRVEDNTDGTSIIVFNAAVTFTGGAIGATFKLNGTPPTAIAQIAPAQLQCDTAAVSGDPWSLTASPPWISETCTAPASGFIL